MESNIIIAGDICPIGKNTELFEQGDVNRILRDFKLVFDSADLIIANLECPLIESAPKLVKSGPNLSVPEDCINGLEALGIDILGLANNHIMDYGQEGLRNTIRLLEGAGIKHVGAGKNIQTAGRVLTTDVNGLRVGIYAAAENEFGMASETRAGANPLDVINAARDIQASGQEYDRLIVLIHGGNEHFPYPRPGLIKTCRFLVEQGADIVVCQHSHISGCMETYQGGKIIYGQGNFLFDMKSSYLSWRTGCFVKISCVAEDINVDLIPFAQPVDKGGVERLSDADEKSWFAGFEERSSNLGDINYLSEKWLEYCLAREYYYTNVLLGRLAHIRRLLQKIGLEHWIDPERIKLARLNLIRCESHREALIRILENDVLD